MKIVVITGSHHKNGTSAHFEVQRKPDTKSVGLMLPFGRYILVLPVKLATTPTEAVPLQMIWKRCIRNCWQRMRLPLQRRFIIMQ